MIGFVVKLHGAVTIIMFIFGAFIGTVPQILSLFFGSLMMGMNYAFLVWSWQRFLGKKSIALTGGSIVIKYAILGVVLYFVATQKVVDVLWFVIGLTSVVPTAVMVALRNSKEAKDHGGTF